MVYPFFNNVDVNPDAANEKTQAFELGYKFSSRNFGLNLNGYWTNWIDKSFSDSFQDDQGGQFFANLSGVDALHKGIEMDAKIQATPEISFTLSGSLNDWRWENNLNTTVFDEDQNPVDTVNLFIEDFLF